MQFGDPYFPELMTIPAERLYHSITQDEFVKFINVFKMRESHVRKVVETANNFKYKWHNFNSINACIRFHHRRDPTGHHYDL